MYWRRFPVSSIPVDDNEAFDLWLRERWIEKDKLLEQYVQTGRFPANDGFDSDVKQNGPTSGGYQKVGAYIETEVCQINRFEFLLMFAPTALIIIAAVYACRYFVET